MSVTIKEVTSKKDIKEFVDLQFRLYKGNKNWVPPIKADEYKYVDPAKNPAFKYFDTKFYLAYKDGKVVGRIGASINHLYNEKTGKKYVRLIKPEFIDDKEVFDALIGQVEKFGKERGMDTIHGPLGFTNLDTQGLLVEGFDYLQSIASVYHLPYYKEHFERLGFEKENDWIEFRLTLTEKELGLAKKYEDIIMRRYGFSMKDIKTMKEALDAGLGDVLFEVLNEAFDELPYVTPFNEELSNYYINKYFKVLNPKYIKVVMKDEEVAGFVVGMPSLSKAMQKANGHLFPFGFIHLMKAMKKNDTIDLLLTGVRKKYQNSGVAVILFSRLQGEFMANGGKYFETTGIFEQNTAVIANWKKYEQKIQHKRRRCYVKPIS